MGSSDHFDGKRLEEEEEEEAEEKRRKRRLLRIHDSKTAGCFKC